MNMINYYSNFFFLAILSLFGTYIFYYFVIQDFNIAFFSLLVAFVVYFSYVIYVSFKHPKKSSPQALMEVITIFTLFLFPLVAYGIILFNSFLPGLILIALFTLTQLINFIQNWTRYRFEEKGFPIMLHGLFFPLTYFGIQLFIPSFDVAGFLLYYIITSILSISPIHFINYQENVFNPNTESKLEHSYYTKHSDNDVQAKKPNTSSKNTNQSRNRGDDVLDSIPFLEGGKEEKKQSKSLEKDVETIEDFQEDSIDEDDEKFFNSLNPVKK